MKLRRMIALVAALVALALMAMACNKTESLPNTNANSSPGKNSSSTPGTTTTSPGTTSSGTNPTSSPTEVTKAFYDAAKSKDIQGMKNVMSKKTLDAMDKAAQAQNKSVDDVLKAINDAGPPPPTLETRNETIKGETATVEVSNGKGGWQTFTFIKEDGQWKLDIPE
jgi:hypothetical protein